MTKDKSILFTRNTKQHHNNLFLDKKKFLKSHGKLRHANDVKAKQQKFKNQNKVFLDLIV